MNWNQFKHNLRTHSQQQDQATSVDIDAIWNAIEPQVDALNAKPTKRRFFFLIFAAGVMVTAASWMFFAQNSAAPIAQVQDQSKTELVNIDTNVKEDEKNNNDAVLAQVVTLADPSLSGNNTQTVYSASAYAQKIDESNSEKLASTLVEASPQKITPNTQSNNTRFANETGAAKINTQTLVSNFSPSKKINPFTGPEEKSEKKTNPIPSLIPNPILNTSASITAPNNTPTNAQEALDLKKFLAFNAKLNTMSSRSSELPNPMLASDFKPQIIPSEFNEKSNYKKGVETCWNSRKDLRMFAGVYGGASFVQRTLEVKPSATEPATAWLGIREASETSLEAQHYGVQLGIQHHTGIRLSSGFQRTQIMERYDYEETNKVGTKLVEITVTIIDLNGNITTETEEVEETTSETISKKVYNRYTLMDVPVLLGYHKSFGKWTAGIDAGVFVNLSLATTGIIPDADQMDINLQSSQAAYFNNQIDLSYTARLSLSRTISNGLEINFTPTARYFPSDFSTVSNPIAQKYFMVGGQLGLNLVF